MRFLQRNATPWALQLPEPGAYGVAMCFLPVDKHSRLQCEGVFERIAQEEGLKVLGWRDTPVNGDAIGREARASQPYIEQLFVGRPEGLDEDSFERLLYHVRRRTENEIAASEIEGKDDFYVPSFSCRTIIYKGLMLAPQIEKFYFELANPSVTSALCLGAPALLNQYLSQLEAGPPLPLRCAQRRDQHHSRQRELDERPSVCARKRAARRQD